MASPATTTFTPSISRSHLQLIAYTAMLIDHLGYLFFPEQSMWRWIGRLAFPLFAFMISQGVIYTRNHKRYLLTLLVTTIIAEPAYDLALYGSIVHTAHQSVMVTLLLGAGALTAIRYLPASWPRLIKLLCNIFIAISAAALAFVLQADYEAAGVLLIIACAYITTNRPYTFILPAALIVWFSMPLGAMAILCALATLLIVYFYNPRAPFSPLPKWLTYGFYPGHLIILATIVMAF